MTVLYIILGILLTGLFFLNIKNAAEFICRIIGGVVMLIIYNSVASFLHLPLLGINLITVLAVGFLGLPGGVLMVCLSLFL